VEIVRNIEDLRQAVAKLRISGPGIAMVPTMGALHAGHVALVEVGKEAVPRFHGEHQERAVGRGPGLLDTVLDALRPRLEVTFRSAVQYRLGDLDRNGIVDGGDLARLLNEWDRPSVCCDLDNDGTVGGNDLGQLLTEWF
jgi:hypothetical protein